MVCVVCVISVVLMFCFSVVMMCDIDGCERFSFCVVVEKFLRWVMCMNSCRVSSLLFMVCSVDELDVYE